MKLIFFRIFRGKTIKAQFQRCQIKWQQLPDVDHPAYFILTETLETENPFLTIKYLKKCLKNPGNINLVKLMSMNRQNSISTNEIINLFIIKKAQRTYIIMLLNLLNLK